MTAVLETRGLTKYFGDLHAVEDLDLSVEQGEILGFLGPNGAGKTTTIRMVLDFVRPTRGFARVLDGSGADPAVRARIGYLPGDLHLDPAYTADDVVEFFGALRGGIDRAYYRALLDRFELDPQRPAHELSTGNRRKVGVVQAFVHRPELVILDEPTSGLDPLLQHEFHALVREVVAEGATVFLSSHVLPEVEGLADRVGILRHGHLVTIATIDELRRQARQRIELYVADGVDPSVFRSIPEVQEVNTREGVVEIVVEGSVDRVIKTAAHFEVQRIVTLDTDLEDVFLQYYQDAE